MQHQRQPLKSLTKQDKERLLMQYQGIFKNNIQEYAEKVKPKLKAIKNYSR
jgi:hypothetical protein